MSAHLFAQEPLRHAHLTETAEAGFRNVELWAMTPHFDVGDAFRLQVLKRWLADLSLSAPTFHAPFYAKLEEARKGRWLSLASPEAQERAEALDRTIRAARAFRPLGARIAVIHPSAPAKAGAGDTYERLEESMARLLPAAEEMDLVFALENIPAAMGRAAPLAEFVERIDHPRLRICADAGHALITERENLPDAIARLAPFCAAVHLHDNDGHSDAHLLPGEGAMAWPSFLAPLHAKGYRGPLTFELRRKEEPYRKTLADLGRAISALPLRDAPDTA